MNRDPSSASRRHAQVIVNEHGLARQLSERQLSMIAIGGAIGTGLFLGSALSVRTAGPGVILSYIFAAGITLLLMGCLAEMAVAHPTAGSFGVYADLYLSALGGFRDSLYLLGCAIHRYRRRSRGGCDLHAVVVSAHSGVGLGAFLLSIAHLRECAQRWRLR